MIELRSPRVTVTGNDHDWVASAWRAAIADAARKAREDFPDVFAHADRILADPDRVELDTGRRVGDYAPINPAFVRECAWCGNDFYSRDRNARCCTLACRDELKRWKRHRRFTPR